MTPKLTAVVLGATGAIGEALVHQLIQDTNVHKVITVGRRAVEGLPAKSEQTAEVVQVVVNMDNLEMEAKDALKGANVVFCALGTTRGVAGSAAAFKKVDFEYVAASARLARASGVPHYSLVTSAGANHNWPANDLALFHPLLYIKTKGLAEQAVLQQGFERVSIFRPGALDRGSKVRSMEKLFLAVMPKIRVQDVARLMILDALREPASVQPVSIFEMNQLMAAAKVQNQAPTPSR